MRTPCSFMSLQKKPQGCSTREEGSNEVATQALCRWAQGACRGGQVGNKAPWTRAGAGRQATQHPALPLPPHENDLHSPRHIQGELSLVGPLARIQDGCEGEGVGLAAALRHLTHQGHHVSQPVGIEGAQMQRL